MRIKSLPLIFLGLILASCQTLPGSDPELDGHRVEQIRASVQEVPVAFQSVSDLSSKQD